MTDFFDDLFKIIRAICLMVFATICPPLCLLYLWIKEKQEVAQAKRMPRMWFPDPATFTKEYHMQKILERQKAEKEAQEKALEEYMAKMKKTANTQLESKNTNL